MATYVVTYYKSSLSITLTNVGQCPGWQVSVGACYEVLCRRPYSGPEIECTRTSTLASSARKKMELQTAAWVYLEIVPTSHLIE